MRVLVSVGTDHHPFDRLVRWADSWAAQHPEHEVTIQYGTSAPPGTDGAVELFGRDQMLQAIDDADVVVVSCGPGGVMDVRRSGRLPAVVARLTSLGEHVDDHQQVFARHLGAEGLAVCIDDELSFGELLESVASDPERFRITPDTDEPAGRRRVGELIDELVWGAPARR